MKVVCNYAIARFLPFPETGEFVNIGVAAIAHETGYFDFLFTNDKQRVMQFFKGLDERIYTAGLGYFRDEMAAIREMLREKSPAQPGDGFDKGYALSVFRELVKPKESMFRFSTARTVLTDDPAKELCAQFILNVEREEMEKHAPVAH